MYSGCVKQVPHLGRVLFLLLSPLEERGYVAVPFWASDVERRGS